MEIIQASIFFVILGDLAAGEYFRSDASTPTIEAQLIERGLYPSAADEGWKYLQKYQALLERSVFQNVLVTIRSNWDWYVRRLVEFIEYGRRYVESPELNRDDTNKLRRIDRCGILEQLRLMRAATGVDFAIGDSDLDTVREMSLVRNLGLHNRWEVDQTYLSMSSQKRFQLGELRIFDEAELHGWHSSILVCIRETAKHIAIKYVNAPDYPERVTQEGGPPPQHPA